MVDVNVDFILGQEEPIEAEFVYEPDIVWDADLELTFPVRKHDQLENRDLPNQHPMSAITGLESALDGLGSDISEETQARIEADSTLQTAINNEIVRATSAESSLQTAIDNEEIARTTADTRLEGLIEAEETRAKGVEEQLSDDIEAENTRAINAEETLQDNIDAEEDRAKLAEQGLGESISSETNTRASEITRVEGLISAEQSARISADNTLQGNIDAEELARQNADNALQLSINDVSDDLSDEVTARENADTTLQGLITAEENRAKGVEQQLASSIDSNHQAISSHVSDKNNPHEVTKAQIGLGNVDNTSDLNKPISTATQTALDGKVDKVSVANKVYGTDSDGTQTTYDVGSFGQVDDVQVGGVSVVTNKIAELGTMAGETASNYSTTAQADLRYATASQGALADTSLQPNDNITELTNNAGYITIASVPTAVSQLTNDSNYQTGTQVANSISVETSNRESADNNLQSQIDAIVSSSDVFDIVGTYAELQAYDISTVPVNDIIKVLVDSTHSNAATYYRCVESGGVKSWSYIGSEGAYYTKSETDTLLQAKQDEITSSNKLSADLVDDTNSTNKFVTSSDISTWNAKQNALTAGTGIDITSNTISNSGVRSISTGATNGTISVNTNGTSAEVAVYGLGSAAYTASTAYDASGSASTAETNAKNYADSLASNYATAAQGAKADTALQPADLTGYATETWVGNQGYITGITSSDVTTALGYTPYDSSNPSGYTNNVGTVTSVNNTSPDSNGNVSLTIPTVDQTYSASSTNAQSGTAVAGALAGKADTDLSNLTSTGKSYASGLAMPSGRYINLTLGASGTTYTAPANGEYTFSGTASGANGFIAMYCHSKSSATANAGRYGIACSCPVQKGDSIAVYYGNMSSTSFTFYYAEGEI